MKIRNVGFCSQIFQNKQRSFLTSQCKEYSGKIVASHCHLPALILTGNVTKSMSPTSTLTEISFPYCTLAEPLGLRAIPLTSSTPSLLGLYLSLRPCTVKFGHVTCSSINSPVLKFVAELSLESLNFNLNLRPGSPRASCGVSVREGSVRVK